MKILFFGDGEWATRSLKLILEKGYVVLGIVLRTNPTDAGLAALASERAIRVFKPANVNGPKFLEIVSQLNPDLNISVSYDQILRKPILASSKMGFINVHAGKLPYYRGRNVINWAIINGEKEIGITVHFVDEGIDTGDIIVQRTIPVSWTDTYAEVLDKTVEIIPHAIKEALESISAGTAQKRPQSHLPGTYFAKRSLGDEWLDWADSSLNIYNKIRAITKPGPGALTLCDNKKVVIWESKYHPDWPKYKATPGQVVGIVKNRGAVIKTGDSTVIVSKVEIENRGIHVPSWPIGTRLGQNTIAVVDELREQIRRLEERLRSIQRHISK